MKKYDASTALETGHLLGKEVECWRERTWHKGKLLTIDAATSQTPFMINTPDHHIYTSVIREVEPKPHCICEE